MQKRTIKQETDGRTYSHPIRIWPVFRPEDPEDRISADGSSSFFAERTIDTYDILPEQYAAEEEDAA